MIELLIQWWQTQDELTKGFVLGALLACWIILYENWNRRD